MSDISTLSARFDGLAFPVAKVTYGGRGYSATIRWGTEETFRARASYDHAIGPGARNAVRAALKAHEKLIAEHPALEDEQHVAVPGDLDANTYTFTFIPERFLSGPDFACAECGTTRASTYVVTTLDRFDPINTRTEVCADCHAAITS